MGLAGPPLALAAEDALLRWAPADALPFVARLVLATVPFGLAWAAPRPWGVVSGVGLLAVLLAALVGAGVHWVEGPFEGIGLALLVVLFLALPGAVVGAVVRGAWRTGRLHEGGDAGGPALRR